MNYIQEAEKLLRNYRNLKYSLDRIETEIAKLKWSGMPMPAKAITYDSQPGGSFHQDEMFNIAYKIQCYMEMKLSTETEIEEIDVLLRDLDQEYEHYGTILKFWYVEKKGRDEIAEELGYGVRYIYKLKDKAIRVFAVRLFGLDSLSVV